MKHYVSTKIFCLVLVGISCDAIAQTAQRTENASTQESANTTVPARTNSAPFIIIVNPKNNVDNLDKKFLSDVFLKKLSRWTDNEVIKPVDRRSDSAIRRKFSELIVNRSVAEVKSYWQQKIFAGYDLPPPELNADAEIINFVAKHPGGIGYVSGDTPTQDLTIVKIITIK